MKKCFFMALFTLILLTTACSTEEKQGKEVFEKSLEAMKAVESFGMDMDVKVNFEENGKKGQINSKLQAEVIQKPMAMHQQMQMTMMGDGQEQEQAYSTEMYITEQGIYMFNPQMEQWMKLPAETLDQMKEMNNLQQDPSQQLEKLREFVDDFSFTEEEDVYVLSLSSSGEKFRKLIEDQLKVGIKDPAQLEEMLKNLDIKKIEYTIKIDKQTYYQTGIDLNMEVGFTADGKTASMNQSVTGTLNKFNEVKEIKVPEEALNSAIEVPNEMTTP
jgi:outer membrane lipoprotein-sorting protein